MSQQTVKEAVLATVEAIRNDAAMAKVRYKAQTQWEEDVRCTGRVRDFDPMVIDEPPAFGGGDSAVSPADVVLVALGTCQEIMYVALASTMDIPLDEVKVDVTADLDLNGLMGLDPDTPPGLLEMSYDVHIKSPAGTRAGAHPPAACTCAPSAWASATVTMRRSPATTIGAARTAGCDDGAGATVPPWCGKLELLTPPRPPPSSIRCPGTASTGARTTRSGCGIHLIRQRCS